MILKGASPLTGVPLLDQLPVGPDGVIGTLRAAAEALRAPEFGPEDLLRWLDALDADELSWLHDRSLSRSSHFKYFLAASPRKYTLWLHDYKNVALPDAMGSFAASTHDHRYSFVSRVLVGDLRYWMYETPQQPGPMQPVDEGKHSAGDVYRVLSHEIHRVDAAPGSLTLVVQGPAEKSHSTVFDVATGRSQQIPDIGHDFAGAKERLR